jgi:hypothetical protein
MHPQEAVGQNSTLEKRPQLSFYEPGYRAIALPLPVKERFEMPGDNTIKNAFFGITGAV